ncbi:MAG: hypothetical protein ACE37F_07390 [Nannocystaceae bacterium]|nr:hypothetical protein [bacterium]
MHWSSLLAVSLLLCGCAESTSTPSSGSTSDTPGSTGLPDSPDPSDSMATSSSTEPATAEGSSTTEAGDGGSSTGPAAPQPIELDRAWVEGVEGPWLGPVTGTPIGDLPEFFLDFGWTEEDALVAVADNGKGFRLEFTFSQRDGQWIFTELGELPGGFVQTQDLHPVQRDGDRVRFEVIDQPGYLSVEIEPTQTSFEMAVVVRGSDHGRFSLARPG